MNAQNLFQYKGEFFRVLETTDKSQLAVMTIPAGGDSGAHGLHQGDQFIYCLEGEGQIEIEGERYSLKTGSALTIPAGHKHKGFASPDKDFFFLNIYAPPVY